MDRDVPGPMTPFDELVTTPELQMIKLLIPYAPASGRQTLAALVKYTELRKAVRLFHSGGRFPGIRAFEEPAPDTPADLLEQMRPYLTPQQASALDMIVRVQEMMPLIEMLQASGAMSGNTGEGSGPGFDFSDLLAGMLTPEQQEMFAEYSEMFSHSQQSDQKGDHKDGQ